MVEGPKVWLKKERLQSLIGLLILYHQSSSSTAVEECQNKGKLSLTILDIVCVGKELFFLLSDGLMIRFHFGMNGAERIVKASSDNDLASTYNPESVQLVINASLPTFPKGYRKILTSVFLLQQPSQSSVSKTAFPYTLLYVYDTSLQWRRSTHDLFYENYINPLLRRDVMSPSFSVEEVCNRLCVSSVPLMDSVLDQIILPGVGNIIKCEGLFMSKLHPELIPSTLSKEKLSTLITHLQEFSVAWYLATKRSRDIVKLVYGHDQCTVCDGRIRLIRSGQLNRITYYCPRCQPLNSPIDRLGDETGISSSAHSNYASIPWHCSFCSYENAADAECCTICDAKNPSKLSMDTNQLHTVSSNKVDESANSISIDGNEDQDIDYTVSTLTLLQCKCQKPAKLQRVRKQGPTQHRLFWSCASPMAKTSKKTPVPQQSSHGQNMQAQGTKPSMKKEQRCEFFMWADTKFPSCPHHNANSADGKTTVTTGYSILRRVLKAGPNNGRYFYACSVPKCSFFQWEPIETTAATETILGKRNSTGELQASVTNRRQSNIRIPL